MPPMLRSPASCSSACSEAFAGELLGRVASPTIVLHLVAQLQVDGVLGRDSVGLA